MRHGIICPTRYLEQFATQSNFHLILPHLFEQYPRYKEFYKKKAIDGDFIICDNSLFELGKCMDYKDVLEKAEDVGASVVVGPEVFGSYSESLRLMYEFLEWKDKVGSKMKVLGIAQGKNSDEIYRSFFHLNSIAGIDYLGLPFMLDYEEEGESLGIKSLTLRRVLNRWSLVFTIALTAQSESIYIKPTHLFGLSDAVELQKYKDPMYSWIFSNDSSSAFVHGFNCVRYIDKGLPCEKIKQKVNFGLDIDLTSSQVDHINYNIDKILSWC